MSINSSTKKLMGVIGCIIHWIMGLFILWMEYRMLIKIPKYVISIMLITTVLNTNLVLIGILFGIKTIGGTIQQVMNKEDKKDA